MGLPSVGDWVPEVTIPVRPSSSRTGIAVTGDAPARDHEPDELSDDALLSRTGQRLATDEWPGLASFTTRPRPASYGFVVRSSSLP